MISPYDVIIPDFRPRFGVNVTGIVPSGGSGGPTWIWDASATYKGAVKPADGGGANVPWYAGWTRGWQANTLP